MNNHQTIDISTATFLRFILIILGLVFLYLIRDILLMLFIAVIISAAIDGPVDWLARHKVRRVFGTAITYVSVFVVLALFAYLVLPPLAGQIKTLAINLPELLAELGSGISLVEQKIGVTNIQNLLDNLSGQLSGAASNILGTAVNIFGGIFNALVILVISIYLVAQDKSLKAVLANVMPEKYQAYAANLAERIQNRLGAWLRGQLLLMFIIALLSFIGLALLKVKFALTLALLAGLFEIIPFVGPILACAVAVTIVLPQSLFLALLVLILYIVVHQLEAYLIAPQVMKRVVGLNPLIVIIALVIGGEIAGILGVVVAVPAAAVLWLLLNDFVFARGP